MSEGMRLSVDRSRCTGVGMCESTSPAYFEVDDDAQLGILREDIASIDLAEIRRAVVSCPTGALRIES